MCAIRPGRQAPALIQRARRRACRPAYPCRCWLKNFARQTPRITSTARVQRWPPTAQQWSASKMPAPKCSTTAIHFDARLNSVAMTERSTTPVSCPLIFVRFFAKAKVRLDGSLFLATRATLLLLIAQFSKSFLVTKHSQNGCDSQASKLPFKVCLRAFVGSVMASVIASGCVSMKWSNVEKSLHQSLSVEIT